MSREIRYCKTCLMPDSRPRIVFDDNGICNACHTAEEKKSIDWDARRAEFLEYVERYRPKDGPYDCIVPWSGGKDSSMIAHKLKFEFGLNPLLVTFSPLIPNEVGEHNRQEFLKLGFDHIMVRPNQKVARRLSRRFFTERGHPKVAWDAGINSVPVQVAVNYNIPLMFYAEHGESEYGGRVLSEEHKKVRDIAEVLEHQIGDDPMNWMDEEIEERDLAPYVYPDMDKVEEVGVTALYWTYFFPWDVYENYEYMKNIMDFKTAPSGRTSGTLTDYDSLDDKIDDLYYHLQYIKFGFGRASRDATRMIYRGRLTREEALESALKYDAETPDEVLPACLEYFGMTMAEYTDLIDKHRNEEIWEKSGNEWKLRFPPE